VFQIVKNGFEMERRFAQEATKDRSSGNTVQWTVLGSGFSESWKIRNSKLRGISISIRNTSG